MARMPVIKAAAALPAELMPLVGGGGGAAGPQQAQLAVDISVDSPAHAGIASTRFTQFLCQELRYEEGGRDATSTW